MQNAEFDAQLDAIDTYCDARLGARRGGARQATSVRGTPERRGCSTRSTRSGAARSCIIALGARAAERLGGGPGRRPRPAGAQRRPVGGAGPGARLPASPEGRVAAKALASVSSWEHERTHRGSAAAAVRIGGDGRVAGGARRPGAEGAHRDDARGRDDVAGDRRRAQQRRRRRCAAGSSGDRRACSRRPATGAPRSARTSEVSART